MSDDVEALVRQKFERGGCIGLIVGVMDEWRSRLYGYGSTSLVSRGTPDVDTLFEIGSVGKVFTVLLLADMVQRGEAELEEPVRRLLPALVSVPRFANSDITLLQLATHTSGLPRMPDNFRPRDPANPYADYTIEQMYDFLSSYRLLRMPGAEYEYSNLGAGLLGHALELLAATGDGETSHGLASCRQGPLPT
jgi:CubicO group peptidase (beta-lactamase class C family)